MKVLSVFLLLLLWTGCGAPDRVSPLYFVLLPPLRGGGLRPDTPANLRGGYDIYLRRINLNWDISFDPDLQIPVGVYRVYLYTNGPPRDYYRSQDILDEALINSYSLSADPFSGSLYFVVTAFDGIAESLPGNVVRVTVFNQ